MQSDLICLVLACFVLFSVCFCLVLSCLVLSCLVLSCLVLFLLLLLFFFVFVLCFRFCFCFCLVLSSFLFCFDIYYKYQGLHSICHKVGNGVLQNCKKKKNLNPEKLTKIYKKSFCRYNNIKRCKPGSQLSLCRRITNRVNHPQTSRLRDDGWMNRFCLRALWSLMYINRQLVYIMNINDA